jgi:hypothetical protein
MGKGSAHVIAGTGLPGSIVGDRDVPRRLAAHPPALLHQPGEGRRVHQDERQESDYENRTCRNPSMTNRISNKLSHIVRIVTIALATLILCLLSLIAPASASAVTLPGHAGQCPVLRIGSKGSCVAALQRRLNREHVQPHVAVDGTFGQFTVEAVKNFQCSRGLSPDGMVGPKTAHALATLPHSSVSINPGSTTVLVINWQAISIFGAFIFLTLIVVLLIRRIRRIRLVMGQVFEFILECGLTQADLEADIMKSLVQLRAKTVTDEEFRILAQYLVANYFTSNGMPERGIRMRRPRKILEGRVERD